MKIKPVGNKMIVLPLEGQNQKSEGGLEIVQNEISIGEIVEVSDELKEYAVSDKVLFPTGSGQAQFYNGKSCFWLMSIEIWGILTEQ